MGAGKSIEGLYAIIDSSYLKIGDMEKAAVKILEGGAKIIQLRAKDFGSNDMLEAAMFLKTAAQKYNAIFIMNDRIDIAMLSGADGVHLGQDDIPVTEARKLLGNKIIGISTHDPKEATEAEAQGADYISFGPIFATKTKKDAQTPRGIEYLKEIRKAVTLPIAAIGGITEGNMKEVLLAGADSVAIISDILTNADPKAKTASIIRHI
ncbi:MAG: thiamine phosphate synthase [Deltaproteobacteria bacterium]|nr:thiamine phosphate synthase [Deltaproteobacteria bacterium]